ncbi:MAG: response regulator, partial [Myxococcota bacterium]
MRRVLVVDDEQSIGEVLRTLASKRGLETVVAEDAETALDLFGAGGYDLVLCDVILPGRDGLDFLERARDLDPDVPVVLMTAYTDKAKLTRAVRLNAFDFIEKPFDLEVVEVVVNRALAQRQILLNQTRTRWLGSKVETLLRSVNATPDLARLYETFENQAPEALDVTDFAVFARIGDALECRLGAGRELWLKDDWSDAVLQCLETGEVTAVKQRGPCLGIYDDASGAGICLPLWLELQRWGMLVLFREGRSFDDIDFRHFRMVSDHLSSSITLRERSAELERALRALEEAQGRLLRTEKLASVTKLVAGMAHEIKNPLTSMQFALANAEHELETADVPDENTKGVRKFLELVASDVGRLRERVDRFMELARPEAAAREHVDVGAVLNTMAESVRPRAEASDVALRVDVDERMPTIELDPVGLENAVLNLVVNSLEAFDGPGEVVVAAKIDSEWLVVSVTDDGPGLSIEARDRMFDIFFTPKARGAGLGRSQVHVFTETHGGDVR